MIRRWNLFEALTGRLAGQRDDPRSFVAVSLAGAVLRPQKGSPQIVGELRRTLGKHREARTEEAQKRRQAAYNAIGLPGSTREFAVEAEKQVYVPYFVGLLRRKGTERFIAVHGSAGGRSEAVEHGLHEKIDVVRAVIEEAERGASTLDRPDAVIARSAPTPPESAVTAPVCRCGATMMLRHRKSDDAAFWGCATFPRCRHTVAID